MIQNNKFTTYDMCLIAFFTAVISVLAQIAIPLPSGVPITLQTFGIILTGLILGSKKGAFAVLIYLLLGAVGLPVFHGFKGGLQSFIGPTGGFLLSFPIMTFFIGLGAEKKAYKYTYPVFLLLGTVLNYGCAVLVYHLVMHISIPAAFAACVLPFIPSTILISILASMIGFNIKKRLRNHF